MDGDTRAGHDGWPHAANAGRIPVLHSVISPRTVLAHVSRYFSVQAPATCHLIKQSLNETYLIRQPERSFIARAYATRRPASEIAYELDLLTHLASRNVRVPAPVAANDGKLAVALGAPEGDRAIALFPYAEGAQFACKDAAQCRLAGRLLARVHDASDAFKSSHWRRRLDVDFLIDDPLHAIRPFLAHRPADLDHLENLGARLRARLTGLAAAGLDWGVCHGDFGAKNIHDGGGETDATIIDFDSCGEGWRAYDFAPIRRATLNENEELWNAFLVGYGDVRPIRAVDLQAVSLFRLLRHLSMLGVFARNVDVWGVVRLDDSSLDRWFRTLRAWDAHQASQRP